MRINIVIPSFNNQESLSVLIKKINVLYNKKIIVVDDGSKTPLALDDISNVKILRNNINRGKGYALMKGFKYSVEEGFTHSITLDSDLQHDPLYIKKFIEMDERYDMIIGKRKFSKTMPASRRLSNRITSNMISSIAGLKIKDSQSGYRRYNLSIFKELDFKEFGFQFESEAIIKYARNQAKFNYIDISTIYNNESSSQRIIIDTLKFIRMIVKNFR